MLSMQKAQETETAKELRSHVHQLSAQITENAVHIVHEKMPKKVMALEALGKVY